MKSPLWIINSILAVILVAMAAFILYSLKNITQRPRIGSIKTMQRLETVKKEGPKPKDLRLIYEENDLFGTFKAALIPEKPIEVIPSLPRPPAPKPVITQQPPPIQFLEPLPIKITGIIASSNEAKSQVSIMNNNTKKTDSYKVGDKLFDAYIIRIFPRKIIIIRSNGQQETLFMFPSDAQAEIKNMQDASWNDVVQRQSEFSYLVSPSAFTSRITSLAQFIDMVDITTAFKNGQSLGMRIGKMDNKSIGYALGFMPGDTVITIHDIAPTTTKNRLQIYNKVSQADLGTRIKVQFVRKGQLLTNEYTLFNLPETAGEVNVTPTPLGPPENLPALPIMAYNEAQEVRRAVLESNREPSRMTTAHSDDAYMRELKKRDKQAMQNYGSRAAMLSTPPYTS